MEEGNTTSPHTSEYLAENQGHVLVAFAVLFIIVDSLFVALRFYAQRLNKTPFGLDDLIIPFAWLVQVGLCLLGIIMVKESGVGRHLAFVMHTDPTQIISWAKSIYALEWLYLPAVAIPKVSILLLYLRIFQNRAERMISHALIYIVLANWIAYLIAASLQCFPFEYQWNKNIEGGKCVDQPVFYRTVSAPNIATDLVILVLPMRMIVKLKTSASRKIGLLFVFLSGSVGLIAACFRMAAFFQTEAFVDNTYASVKLVGWSIAEPGMYLLAACSLKLRPVFIALARILHIRNIYGSGSGHGRGAASNGKEIPLNALPSRELGFNKIHSGPEDASSITNIITTNPGCYR